MSKGFAFRPKGLIRVTSLADDRYRFDRTTHTLTGARAGNSFRLGDRVRVSVARVDVDRRELDFRLVTRLGRSRPPAPSGPQGRKGRSPASRRSGTSVKRQRSPKKLEWSKLQLSPHDF